MDNNLLFIITMMLKDEIDKLQNVNQIDSFLENTKCGYLLEELRKMADIQSYFKKIIFKTVEEMERRCSFREINFNVFQILNELKKIKEKEEKNIKKEDDKSLDKIYEKFINSKILDPSINYSKDDTLENHNNNEIFMNKYVAEININEFEKLAENAKKENKNELCEYFNKFINNIKLEKKNELYSNTMLVNNMLNTKLSTYLLAFYKNNCLEIISFVNQLIENIMNNILLIPSSIKYICKIISFLIRQKFKNITKVEENAFISKFILEKLLIPIIIQPSHNALINEFIISGNTIKNIQQMNLILKKLFSGKLFKNDIKEGNYTPFNWFLMEKMETILNFFEKVIKINLPNYIEKYINNDLEKDDYYDFFKENKDIICSNLSVCLTIDNLIYLVQGLELDDKIFENKSTRKLKISLTKLKSESTLTGIKNLDDKIKKVKKESQKKEDTENNETINYYVYNEIIIEEKYKYLFSLNNQIDNFLKKIKKKKLDEKEKILIKIKSYLCSSLGNFRTLNKSDFNIGSTSNTIKMLSEIKSYMTLPYFILNNNTVPSIWYINSILNYINKIPEDYKNNDYKKLFTELTENINDSINELDFESLILFRNKLKFLDKMISYYGNIKQLKNNIIINENIKLIAEQAFIPVDITFLYKEEYNKFELKKSDLKEKAFEDKIIYEDSKRKFASLKTIEAFTRYFPNLNKYQISKDNNSIDIIEKLNIHNYINKYFELLKEKIIKKRLLDIRKYDSLYSEKLKDYIMTKLYPKIYPSIPNNIDEKIYENSVKLSWIDPHILLNKEYIFDNILPEIINEFNQINILKTPYQKLKSIKKIMEYIDNIIKFNEGIDKEIGAEDVTPVLNYLFIKAQPKRIYTDIKFTALFTENCGKYENSLANFESMCIVMNNCSAETFGFTKEEFDKRCNEEVNEIKII